MLICEKMWGGIASERGISHVLVDVWEVIRVSVSRFIPRWARLFSTATM